MDEKDALKGKKIAKLGEAADQLTCVLRTAAASEETEGDEEEDEDEVEVNV